MVPLHGEQISSLDWDLLRYHYITQNISVCNSSINQQLVPMLLTLQAIALDVISFTGLLFGGDRMYWLRPSPWKTPFTHAPNTVQCAAAKDAHARMERTQGSFIVVEVGGKGGVALNPA